VSNSNEPRQIFLGNISYDAHPDDVVAALRMANIGAARVRLATWKETGAPRGFGFLDLETSELRSTEEVIDRINEAEISLLGRVMRADLAKPREPRSDPERARNEATWREPDKKKGSKPKGKRPGGGRGRSRSEFQRGRNEFEGE
jgi:RNA recognition motif-containing protein